MRGVTTNVMEDSELQDIIDHLGESNGATTAAVIQGPPTERRVLRELQVNAAMLEIFDAYGFVPTRFAEPRDSGMHRVITPARDLNTEVRAHPERFFPPHIDAIPTPGDMNPFYDDIEVAEEEYYEKASDDCCSESASTYPGEISL